MLEQASKQSSNPRKLFDDAIEVALRRRNSRSVLSSDKIAAAELQHLLSSLCGGIENEPYHLELASAVVRLCNWEDQQATVALIRDVRDFLCRLCSFRTLQKRIQVRLIVKHFIY